MTLTTSSPRAINQLKSRATTPDPSRPNTWTAGTEINFGGGLFGKRYTGTFPAIAANTGHSLVVDATLTNVNCRINNYGGC